VVFREFCTKSGGFMLLTRHEQTPARAPLINYKYLLYYFKENCSL
jgi:hypothetical protein